MTRSQHPSVGIRAVPNPDDEPTPEAAARVRDAKDFLDMLLLLGPGAPLFNVSITLAYTVKPDMDYQLCPESQRLWDAADYVEVVDKYVRSNGELGYVVVNLWYGELTVRAMCHAPEAIGVWTPPAQAEGTFTLMKPQRLPLWAE
jgi:hypothetical protein